MLTYLLSGLSSETAAFSSFELLIGVMVVADGIVMIIDEAKSRLCESEGSAKALIRLCDPQAGYPRYLTGQNCRTKLENLTKMEG